MRMHAPDYHAFPCGEEVPAAYPHKSLCRAAVSLIVPFMAGVSVLLASVVFSLLCGPSRSAEAAVTAGAVFAEAAGTVSEESAGTGSAVSEETAGIVSTVNAETGYQACIVDDADLMSRSEEDGLLSVMAEMTAFGNAYCYTTDDSMSDPYNYAGDRYEEMFGMEPGSIFVIAMGNRQLYLYNEGSIKRTITSAAATSIVDNYYTLASEGDYGGCAEEVFGAVVRTLNGRLLHQPLRIITVLLLSVLIAVMINYYVMVSGRRKAAKIGDNLSASVRMDAGAARGIVSSWLGAGIASFVIESSHRYHISHDSGGSGGSSGGGGFSGGGGGHSGSGGGHGF